MATKSRALRLLKDTIGAGAVRTGRWPNKDTNHTRRHPAASGGASPHEHLRTFCTEVCAGAGGVWNASLPRACAFSGSSCLSAETRALRGI